jgi:phosphoribosylanthranilate isomerase
MEKIISQIYEIQTRKEAEQMVNAGVDHIGSVIVSARNWKQPGIKETLDFVAQTDAKSSLILLFNDPDFVFSSLEYYRPDIVHFCEVLIDSQAPLVPGSICVSLIQLQKQIRKAFPQVKIMRTIPIPDNGSDGMVPFLELAKMFEPVSDYFLTDTIIVSHSGNDNQPVEGFVGITGKTCDWNSATQLVEASQIPVILAGGLSSENVYEGIRLVRPAGVDSCTLTNMCDAGGRPIRFKKDMAKVRQFLGEMHRACGRL